MATYINRLGTCLLLLLSLVTPKTMAQESSVIGLDTCYFLAKKNYPLTRQFELIERTKELNIENISRGIVPRIQLNGQASYQSDVTQVPGPALNIPTISKDQYRIYSEIVQPLTDLFNIEKHKQLASAQATVQMQQNEVALYQLEERINQLYFGILLLDEQLKQTQLVKADIQTGIKRTNAAIENGVALKSELEVLKAESLKIDQKVTSLQSGRQTFIDMLAQFTLLPTSSLKHLQKPSAPSFTTENNRPERMLYNKQKEIYAVKHSLVQDKTLPNFHLFFQSGYGRPALNMLDNGFDFFYIGGIRMQWNISGFYTKGREKQLLNLGQKELDVQEASFLFNTGLNITQQSHEIAKLRSLIETDKRIIQLRENIKSTAQAQLENGVITASDYLSHVNEADRAKQDLLLHEIQLLSTLYENKITTGN